MTPEDQIRHEITEHFRRNRKVEICPGGLPPVAILSPVAELAKGLPPGTRLTINVELPYDREYPVLHSETDPEADE